MGLVGWWIISWWLFDHSNHNFHHQNYQDGIVAYLLWGWWGGGLIQPTFPLQPKFAGESYHLIKKLITIIIVTYLINLSIPQTNFSWSFLSPFWSIISVHDRIYHDNNFLIILINRILGPVWGSCSWVDCWIHIWDLWKLWLRYWTVSPVNWDDDHALYTLSLNSKPSQAGWWWW